MSEQGFGDHLKNARSQRGWDQATLASAMDVKQQTVSRWESGLSRPRRDDVLKLAELFAADADVWLVEAGYRMIEKPVRPLAPVLPLDKLSAEDFEFFSRDFVQALNPVADVSRYGGQGDTQEGIDLLATEGSVVRDYQCKRHAQFGPSDVKKAIAATTFVAEHHHLLLSRRASPGARKAILGYADWSLWDAENISAKVRSLPTDDALHLVDTYFPGWRKGFLGVDEPSPWLSSEQFYRRLTNRTLIFNHGWPLVGRQREVETLTQFALQGDQPALILSGRGGVGKSRLLRAFAESLPPKHKVLFLAPGAEVTPLDIEHLPAAGALVIDDAHEYIDLVAHLNSIALTKPNLKVLLSTRPYGLAKIRDALIRTGIDSIDNVVHVGDLTEDDARQLAAEIMAEYGGDSRYALRIAEITKDCPLATVVGARLVAQGRLNPELLNSSTIFRTHLLQTFRQIIEGDIGGSKNAAEIRDLLDFVALIQPFDPESPAFKQAAQSFLERRETHILRDLRALEDAGVLLRRGSRLRIVPDLLADYIRESVSYDEHSLRPTGYADKVFGAVTGELVVNVLVNLSQLDWRMATTSEAAVQSAISDQVWSALESEFGSAKIGARLTISSMLEKVAYYQPARALALVRLAISQPTDEVEDNIPSFFSGQATYTLVLNTLPPILRDVAYAPEYLIEALDLLKELAKQDRRPPNQNPDHPLRVLTQLAAVGPGKPFAYVQLVVTYVLSWLPEEESALFSPFDVVKAALATEGQEPEFSGNTMRLKSYTVNAAVVEPLRQQIIDKAFETILTRPVTEAVRAVGVIAEALRGPVVGISTPEAVASWVPGILAILKRLEAVVANAMLDPYIAVEIRQAVQYHAVYSSTATGPAARAMIAAIPTSVRYEVSRALADSWGQTFERLAGTGQQDAAAFDAWRKRLAHAVITEYASDIDALIQFLEERVNTLQSLMPMRHSDPGPFIGALIEESAAFGETLGEHILANPDSPLTTSFGVALTALAREHYDKALALAEAGAQQQRLELSRQVGFVLGWRWPTVPISAREMTLIEDLAQSSDAITKQRLAHVVSRFAPEQKTVAISFLANMPFGDSAELADEILGEFGIYSTFSMADLGREQVEHILSRLVKPNSLDHTNIVQFLIEASATAPTHVAQLLFDRVAYWESQPSPTDYGPIPYSWAHRPPFRFQETEDYERLLQSVFDWVNAAPTNAYRRQCGPIVFRMISASYDETTARLLSRWAMSPSQQDLETTALLIREADNAFVWRQPQLVSTLVEKARRFSEACYDRVEGLLITSVVQGLRSGTPGQPFAEDIGVRDRAQQLMATLVPGSPTYRFYKALYDHALVGIKVATAYDPLDD